MADVAPLNAAVLPTIAVPVQRTRNNKPTSFLSVFIPTPWASPTATPCPSPTPKSTGDFTTGIRPVRHRSAQTIMLALSICLAFAVTIKFVFLDRLVSHLEHVTSEESGIHPGYGALLMVAAIGFGTPCGAAVTPFNLAAGGLFGVWVGSICVMAGCLIGCNLNWWIARHYFKEWAQQKLQASPQLRKLELAIDTKGITMVALGRLSPIFPFSLLSYVLGVTNVTQFQNSVGTAIGLLPGILLQASMGHNMKRAMDGKADSSVWYGISFSVLTTIVMTWQVSRIWNNLPDAAIPQTSESGIHLEPTKSAV